MPSTAHAPTHASNTAGGDEYRIHADTTVVAPGEPRLLTFAVVDGDGEPVTRFEDRHERPMHLILISNDLADYAHLHPVLGADGTWSAELPSLGPGGYRLVADTVPAGGPDLVLTVDLVVPGVAAGRPLPEPIGTAVVDGLDVDLDLAPTPDGFQADLTVRRDGAVVEPDPYLGARGHLVAIDADDLAYLHVHPTDGGSGPVSFAIADPDPGRYRLFFDFSVDGVVRTAAFTVDIGAGSSAGTSEGHAHAEGEGHR
jgi:hypothetical protein